MPKKTATKKSPTPRRRTAPASRLHLYIATSLDGYIAAHDGSVDFLTPYSDALSGFPDFMQSIGACIMGRATYAYFLQDPTQFGDRPVYVLTSRPLPTPTPPNVTPVARNLQALTRSLRAQTSGNIWHLGGGRSLLPFLEADLIDLFSIFVVPTLLGDGARLFPSRTPTLRRLTLSHTHTFPSGVVELRYSRP